MASRKHCPRGDWNAGYASGNYDGADDESQWVRYAVMGGILRRTHAQRVLDVGCGYGTLREFIPHCSYTGLDTSQVVLERIADRRATDQWICADVEIWQPVGHYDAVVLSEVLYYLANPRACLEKVKTTCLVPGGALLVSLFHHPGWRSPNRHALREARKFLQPSCFSQFQEFGISVGPSRWSILAAILKSV